MRGLRRHIKKDRIVEFPFAKGNDARSITPPPIARFRMYNISSNVRPPNLKSLVVQFIVKKDGSELNRRVLVIDDIDSFTGYISDNKNRSEYPNGLLEFYLRLPKWQKNAIWSMDWIYGAAENRYLITELNLDGLPNVRTIRTANDGGVNAKISNIDLSKAKEIREIFINRNALTSIDITSNVNLISLTVIDTNNGGTLQHLITGGVEYLSLNSANLIHNNLQEFDIIAPNLTSLQLTNSTQLGNIAIENYPLLQILNVANCGMNYLDVSEHVNLTQLRVGAGGGNANNNNFGDNLIGLENLSELIFLGLSRANVIMENFNLDLYPQLQNLDLSRNGSITGEIISTFPNLNMLVLDIRSGTNIVKFNPEHMPNLRELRFNDSSNPAIEQFDLTKLKKLTTVYATNTFGNSADNPMVLYDFSENEVNMSGGLFLTNNHVIQELRLPNTTVTVDNIYNMSNLSKIVINTVERTNLYLYICDNSLTELDTSYGEGTCLPNVTRLALGGGSATYTSTGVYDFRKNNLTDLIIRGNIFQTSGSIGTDTCAVATLMDIQGDANLSYTTPASFPATMRRVLLRPSISSGLATSGGQVADLIIDLSTKSWATGQTTIMGTNYTHRVIDLRGNCATPTPSTQLTTALNLLNSKGVTVLTN